MKKLFLLSTVVLLSALNAGAIDWRPLNVATPNIDVYYDADALKIINNQEYYYIIKYQALGQTEKVAYIKANLKTKRIGIIQAGDYDLDTYRPNAVFANPHALMKPVDEDSFLYYANDEVAKLATDFMLADEENGIVPVAYRRIRDAKTAMTPAEYASYMEKMCKILKDNWNAPIIAVGTKTTLKATIGRDGSLQSYKIIESSNYDPNDRSVISALEKTVVFPQYTTKDNDFDALDFLFIFSNNLFKNEVIY